MYTTDVAIIGGGQAGLAMSRCLFNRGIEHLVFERGTIGGRWQSHTWDSLRLLTPNWMNLLPEARYEGDDLDGFMLRDEHVARLRDYAAAFDAPVMEQTAVTSLTHGAAGFQIETDRGIWRAQVVVVATGQCDLPNLPDISRAINPLVTNLHSSAYRSPLTIADGGVLVVGASSSGVQIADEIRRSGRDVTLAVGRHTRLPRTWRGRDIFWWLDRMGVLAERTRDLANPQASRRQPSLQLTGRPDRANIDLATLQGLGVKLVGRMAAVEGDTIAFANDLASSIASAEVKQRDLLARIDAFAGLDRRASHAGIKPVDLSRTASPRLSLAAGNINTIVWATGYRRAYPWLKLPALGTDGEIAHWDGVTAIPGLYALGFRLLRKRDSNFIGGVASDAVELSKSICAFLDQRGQRAA